MREVFGWGAIRRIAWIFCISLFISALFSVEAKAQSGSGDGGGGDAEDAEAAGEKLISTVASLRGRKAIGNIAGLASVIAGREGMSAELILDDVSERLRFRAVGNNLWASASYQSQVNKRAETSEIFGASFGGHIDLNDQNVLGAVVLFDALETQVGSGGAEATGWLAGGYFAGYQRQTRLSYDVAVLAGQGTSQQDPVGNYTDEVTTDRIIVTGNVARQFQNGPLRIIPSLNFKYSREDWPNFVDQEANSFDARIYEFAEFKTQVRAEYIFGSQQSNRPRLSSTFSLTSLEELQPEKSSTVYGSAEVGLTVPINKNNDFRISWKRDRIGDEVPSTTNVQLRINLRF